MIDPTQRTGARLVAIALTLLIPLAASGCGAEGGNSDGENEALAAELSEQIADELPQTTVELVNYQNDVTMSATLAISVEVADPVAAVAALAGSRIPDQPELTDPQRPLAPLAAQIAQLAWESEIDPIGDLRISIGNGADPQGGDSWSLGISGPDTSAAFEEAFGPRPT